MIRALGVSQSLSQFNQIFKCRKLADGLFLETCREVSDLYPKIEFESMIVDNTCMQVSLLTLSETYPVAHPNGKICTNTLTFLNLVGVQSLSI